MNASTAGRLYTAAQEIAAVKLKGGTQSVDVVQHRKTGIALAEIAVIGSVSETDWTADLQWDDQDIFRVRVPLDPRLVSVEVFGLLLQDAGAASIYPPGSVLIAAQLSSLGRLPAQFERVIYHERNDKGLRRTLVGEFLFRPGGDPVLETLHAEPANRFEIPLDAPAAMQNIVISSVVAGAYVPAKLRDVSTVFLMQ